MNATKIIRQPQVGLIESSIQEAETKTGAEIVCAVATESGRYDRAESIFGAIGALLGLAGGHLIAQSLDTEGQWSSPPVFSLLMQSALVTGGFILGTIFASFSKPLRALVVSRSEVNEEVTRSAQIVLSDAILSSPRSAGSVLLYISLAERRASILCDRLAIEALEQQVLDEICALVISHIKQKDISGGLITGVEQLAEHLAEKIPPGETNLNELENHVLLIHPRA